MSTQTPFGIKIATFLKNLFESTTFLAIKVGATGIFTIILFCIENDKYQNFLTNKAGVFGKFIIDNALGFLIVVAFFGFLIQIVHAIANKYADDPKKDLARLQQKHDTLQGLYTLIMNFHEAINNVVSEKGDRFATTCDAFKPRPRVPGRDIFNTITNPKAQIKELMKGLYNSLRHTFPNETLKVALMRVSGGVLDGWEHFYPLNTTPRTPLNILSDPNSTISRCLVSKNIIIVPNVKKACQVTNGESPMYVAGNTDLSYDWTQVCDPVLKINTANNTTDVVYIISIAIRKAEIFTTDDEVLIKWMLESFKIRLALEYSLLELKGKAI